MGVWTLGLGLLGDSEWSSEQQFDQKMYKIDSDRPAISLLLIEHLARYVLSKRQMTNHNFKTCINTVDTVLFFYLCKDTKDLEKYFAPLWIPQKVSFEGIADL
jgi:hypothetical protein